MTPDEWDLSKITRLTVVTDSIAFERYGVALEFVVQDAGRTLKVFVKDRSDEERAATSVEVTAGWADTMHHSRAVADALGRWQRGEL